MTFEDAEGLVGGVVDGAEGLVDGGGGGPLQFGARFGGLFVMCLCWLNR